MGVPIIISPISPARAAIAVAGVDIHAEQPALHLAFVDRQPGRGADDAARHVGAAAADGEENLGN